jgi:hypothetical protein
MSEDAKPTWAAFRAKVAVNSARTVPGFTAETRLELEQQGRRADGRSRRRTGRDVKMTLKVKPDFKARLAALAEARGVAMAAVLELALDALEVGRA